MQRVLVIVAATVLVLHGLIHFMGTAAYLKLANVTGIPYKTTLLNGRWDVGDTGIRVFGMLWAVAALGFITAAVALFAQSPWWRSVLLVGRSGERGSRRAWPPPAPMVHQSVAIELGVDRADGRKVRARELLPELSRILGAPQPGYSRFKRTIVASMGAGSRFACRCAR